MCLKKLWENGKIVVNTIFSFSKNVFRSPLPQGHWGRVWLSGKV